MRHWRFGAFMGLLALIGMMLLTTWHDAMPHSHAQSQVTLINDDHHEQAPAGQPDLADLMHVAAHAAHQATELASQASLPNMPMPAKAAWSFQTVSGPGSLDPASLLRPPRA